MAFTDKVKYGDGLAVTDEGAGVIRVDSVGGPQGATGATGATGAAGSNGTNGADGADGGVEYVYLTDTANSDPGSGKLKFNTATLASIATLRISETDNDGNAIAALLASLDDSTSTVKTTVTMVKEGAPSNILVFTISGTITDNGTWDSFTATFVASSGSFANNDVVRLFFSRTGDKGDTGATGATGGTTAGALELVYRYTVAGSDKASIDTGADTADAGTTDWTNGDVLEVWIIARTDDAGAVAAVDINLNNDTGGNYDRQVLQGSNGTASAAASLAQTKWAINAHGSGGSSSYPSTAEISIGGYAGTTFNKVGKLYDSTLDSTAGNNSVVPLAIGYRSTSAITRFKVAAQSTAKLKVGSQLMVYKRRAS